MKIGNYECISSIGKGGMGEVFLVYDPICDRHVALKCIRSDLKNRQDLKSRFLHEAKITSQLTHPGVIAIYNIYQEDEVYYTMPYVEGKTLKEILRHDNWSIASLLPIFKSVCQTVAYAHSKGILHRDLKPENILVGNYGEVIILDWGLAEPTVELDVEIHPELTSPGKIVGTLAFMAPERALGHPATLQTDIYALGVILYQILTLELPFSRQTLKEFRKMMEFEKLSDPEEVAPYRDVPSALSRIVKRALQSKKEARYQTSEELLSDLLSYLEGRSEWFEIDKLDIAKKKDWEFQENVLISKHIAITRATESAEWMSVMISKKPFAENLRLATSIYLKKEGAGIGFLLNAPEAGMRENPLAGYAIWLGSEEEKGSHLFKNTIEILYIPDLFLKSGLWHTLVIEKIDNHIHLTLDGIHRFKHLSYLPLMGAHVGILARDDNFSMKEIVISIGSHPLQVSCLAIPDAFLACKDYKKALAEYRRIGLSFPGHTEGREALFRAGITLLEQGKNSKTERRAHHFFQLALEEFTTLHATAGAPLEYLGKSLVYQATGEYAEEVKCLELALRRYKKHPLLSSLKEQILYRMHESSQKNRLTAYQLILLALRQIPNVTQKTDHARLFKYLLTYFEPLPFFENPLDPSQFGLERYSGERKLQELEFATLLAFWVANPYYLLEIFEELLETSPFDVAYAGNILYALIELGSYKLAKKLINPLKTRAESLKKETQEEVNLLLQLLNPLFICHEKSLEEGIGSYLSLNKKDIGVKEFRTLAYLLQRALQTDHYPLVENIAQTLKEIPLSREDRISLDAYRAWAFLLAKKWKEANEIFESYSLELLNQESTLLHPLFGCYLLATEGEEISHIHFAGVTDTPFPRSWALLGHELANHITQNPAWLKTSFLWERRILYRELSLYHACANSPDLMHHFKEREKQEYIEVPE